MDEPLPMWIFVITSGIAGVLSLFLNIKKDSNEQGKADHYQNSSKIEAEESD